MVRDLQAAVPPWLAELVKEWCSLKFVGWGAPYTSSITIYFLFSRRPFVFPSNPFSLFYPNAFLSDILESVLVGWHTLGTSVYLTSTQFSNHEVKWGKLTSPHLEKGKIHFKIIILTSI